MTLRRNKKGFTLVEMVVTIAIMAILVGFAVPNVNKAIEKRERYSAESDAEEVFRQAIASVIDMRYEGISPNFNLADGVYDKGFAEKLVKRLYDTIFVMDISLVFLDTAKVWRAPAVGEATPEDVLAKNYPAGCEPSSRVKAMSGGNKDPYIVVSVLAKQVLNKRYGILTVSYHNANNIYKHTYLGDTDTDGIFDKSSAYTTNNGVPIVFQYVIEQRS